MQFSTTLVAIFIIGLFFISSCKKDETTTEPQAIIGVVSAAKPMDTVFVNGSQSSYATNYSWTISEEHTGEVKFFSTSNNNSRGYFVATRSGSYIIELMVRNDVGFNTAQKKVVVSGSLKIGGTLTQSLTLTLLSEDSTDYIITEDLIVPIGMRLVIEAGVEILVAEDVAIIVEGEIEINKNYGLAVKLKPFSGNWKGIHYKGNTSTISKTIIEGAGSSSFTSDPNESAALYTETSGLNLWRVTLKNSAGVGLFTGSNVTIPTFSTIIFEQNAKGPGTVSLNVLSGTNMAAMNFTNETVNTYLKVWGSGSTGLSVAIFNKFPVVFLEDFELGSLNINAGGKIYFADGVGARVLNIRAEGSSIEPIIIEGLTKSSGAWKGIYVRNYASLNFTTLKYAGSSSWSIPSLGEFKGGIVLDYDAKYRVLYSEISFNNGFGIVGGMVVHFESDDISYNTEGAIVVPYFNLVDNIAGARVVTFNGYGLSPIITVVSNWVNTDPMGPWPKISATLSSIDYRFLAVTNGYTAYTDWTIEKGVKIQCEPGVNISVGASVTFTAIGTAAERIEFTRINSTIGNWDGFYAPANSTIKLDYVTMNFGGGNSNGGIDTKGCLNVDGSVNSVYSYVTNSIFLNGGLFDLNFIGGDVLGVKDLANNNTWSTSN